MNELIGPELPPGEGAGEADIRWLKCCEPSYSTGPCGRPARAVRDGRPYCGLHDPFRRTAEGMAIIATEHRAHADRMTLCRAVCRDMDLATLDRIASSGGLAAILDAIGELRAATRIDDMAEGLPALLAAGRRLVELVGYEAGREEADA